MKLINIIEKKTSNSLGMRLTKRSKYKKLIEHLRRVISKRNKEIAKLKEELYEPIYLPGHDNPIYLSGLR